jgi:limonene-1,2-epoxide hydrolase
VRGPDLRGQQAFDARLQRRQRRGQHARAGARAQRLFEASKAYSSSELSHTPGSFETVALLGRVAEAGLAVAFHRRHQRIAQERQVAVDGGARAASSSCSRATVTG